MNLDSTIHMLQGRGFRMTNVRIFILKTFKDSKTPLSAGDLTSLIKTAKLNCNRTTVYRELNFLVEQSIIKTVDFGDGAKRYENAGAEHHHHFVCSNCKKVIDVNLQNDLEQQERLLEKIHGVTINSHSLEFFGKCNKCVE
jgi:Fur family ferric uptake transcriptional regulator